MKIQIRGQNFELRGERTVYWEEQKTLLAADLHWGKDVAFHQHGIPIPGGTLKADLLRLSSELNSTGARRLFVLGDLVHSKRSVTPEIVDAIASWRKQHESVEIEVILGNHDRGLRAPDEWRMNLHSAEIVQGEFLFSHDDVVSDLHFVWSGHVHPVIKLRSSTDSLRLPCFVIEESNGLLPAFSLFTGGFEIKRAASRSVFAIADSQVLPI